MFWGGSGPLTQQNLLSFTSEKHLTSSKFNVVGFIGGVEEGV